MRDSNYSTSYFGCSDPIHYYAETLDSVTVKSEYITASPHIRLPPPWNSNMDQPSPVIAS